jgi:hypothetical protein
MPDGLNTIKSAQPGLLFEVTGIIPASPRRVCRRLRRGTYVVLPWIVNGGESWCETHPVVLPDRRVFVISREVPENLKHFLCS